MFDPSYWKRPEPPKPSLSLEDVGTRLSHLTNLLDMWNGGLYIILAKSEGNRSQREVDMIQQLTFAIELLKKHMTGIGSDYHETFYKDIIQHLPAHAEEIKDEEKRRD